MSNLYYVSPFTYYDRNFLKAAIAYFKEMHMDFDNEVVTVDPRTGSNSQNLSLIIRLAMMDMSNVIELDYPSEGVWVTPELLSFSYG